MKVKASINVRTVAGQFPQASYTAALLPARDGLRRDADRAFATASDPVTGRRWPDRKTVRPNPLLVLTGATRAETLRAAAGARVNGSSLTATVNVPKHAAFQFFGTRRGIAARRFLGASIGTIGAVVRALKGEAVRVFRGRAGQ